MKTKEKKGGRDGLNEIFCWAKRNFNKVLSEVEILAKKELNKEQITEFNQCMNANSLQELILNENTKIQNTQKKKKTDIGEMVLWPPFFATFLEKKQS